MFKSQKLSDHVAFGAIVTDLNVAALEDSAVRTALRALWIDRGHILFKDMPDEETHIRLSNVFGESEVHPLRDPAKPGRPELSDVRYDPVFGDLTEFGDGAQRGAWLPWHFDLVYVDRINHGRHPAPDSSAA